MLFNFVGMANTQDIPQAQAQNPLQLAGEVSDPREEARLAFERMKALSHGMTARCHQDCK